MSTETETPPDPCGWGVLHNYVDKYLDGYEAYGETEDGRDTCYTPNANERYLIEDAIQGLLGDIEFSNLLAAAHKKLGDLREAEGECRLCGHVKGGHWGSCPEAPRG